MTGQGKRLHRPGRTHKLSGFHIGCGSQARFGSHSPLDSLINQGLHFAYGSHIPIEFHVTYGSQARFGSHLNVGPHYIDWAA